jgi:hypothetical protein
LGEKIKNLVVIECPTPAVTKRGVQVGIGTGKPDWRFDQRSSLEVRPEAEQEVGPKWGRAETGGWEGMHGPGPDIQV